MPIIHASLVLGAAVLTLSAVGARAADYAYAGTYTEKTSKGIYLYRFDAGAGKLEALGLVAETPNPTFLAIHPNRKYLYAVNEIDKFQGQHSGSVTAFRIDGTKLTALNSVSSHGDGPCHVSIDRSGKFVMVANYGGGSIAVLPIQPDGSLGEATAAIQHTRAPGATSHPGPPHAHSINMSPDNRFAIVADLGLDRIFVYRFDAAKGTLQPNDPPAVVLKTGAGPRHFAFHPNGRVAYSINELQSTVSVFDWNSERGVLTEKQTISTLPPEFKGENSTAEVVVHPNGKFLYGSNRGHDSIAVFAIGADGKLSLVELAAAHVKTPRNFALDPTAAFLFAEGQQSDRINIFRVDKNTGRLTATGDGVDLGAPVCLRFLPAAK